MLKTVGPHLDSLCWKHQAVWCCTGCMSTQRQTGGGGRPSLCHGSWMTCQFYKEPEGDPRSDFSFPAIRRKTHQRIRAESKFLSVFFWFTSCGRCCCLAVNEVWIWSHSVLVTPLPALRASHYSLFPWECRNHMHSDCRAIVPDYIMLMSGAPVIVHPWVYM